MGGRANMPATAKPSTGSRIIWQNKPISTGLGWVKMRRKSATVSIIPNVTIIMAMARGRITLEIILSCMVRLLFFCIHEECCPMQVETPNRIKGLGIKNPEVMETTIVLVGLSAILTFADIKNIQYMSLS